MPPWVLLVGGCRCCGTWITRRSRTGGSKENYALAFELLTGGPPSIVAWTDGRTDPEIMRNLLVDNGLDPSTFTEEQVRAALVESMERNVPALLERGHLLPGVVASGPGIQP